MRIIIELEGTEATVKSLPTGETAVQTQATPTILTNLIPPEVLAAAAATGALNAGPAPNIGAQTAGVPPLTLSTTAPAAAATGLSNQPAGAAPVPSLNEQKHMNQIVAQRFGMATKVWRTKEFASRTNAHKTFRNFR